MPQNWKTYKLGKITTKIGSGATPRGGKEAYKDSGISLIRSQNVLDFRFSIDGLAFIDDTQAKALNNVTIESRDILLNITGDSVARVCQVPDIWIPARVNQHVAILRANKDVLSPEFLLYSLLSKKNKDTLLTLASAGATRNALTKTMVEDFEISIPEIQEQRDIASILSAIDDKIELNLQMNKTLEEMAMALYKHWFVDFGSFQSGEFVKSELGMIPKGWEVRQLGDILKVKHGYAFKGEYFTTDKNKNLLLTPGNFEMQGGIKFNWGKQKYYLGEFPNDYILKRGSLIIALTDLTQSCDILGAPAIIPDEDNFYLHNQRLGLVIDLAPKFSNEFIYCLANTVPFRAYMKNTKTGSTVSHTSPSRIYEYKVALPIEGISEILNAQLAELNNMKFLNLSENKLLTQTRDTLLPKLISGEVRVKDIEQTIAQVL